jgi:hypothetical protein
MAEYKETHIVRSQNGEVHSSAAPWLAFLVGALLIAVVAMFFLNAHGRISGPAGSVDLSLTPPVTSSAAPAAEKPPVAAPTAR